MSTDRDTTRIVRSWLQTDEYEPADRVLDAVLDQLDTIPQRRATWWPVRRLPQMNTTAKLALSAAAIVIVALLGLSYLRGTNVGDPGLEDPSSTGSPSLSPAALSGDFAALSPGAYLASDPFRTPLSFSVPAGWEGVTPAEYATFLERSDRTGWIDFVIFDQVAIDPCQSDRVRHAGRTVADLVTALGDVPGIEITELSDISVDGYEGTGLLMVAPDNFDGCALGSDGYVIWQLPLGAQHSMLPGERHRVMILDVEGERLVISYPEPPQVTDELLTELEQIVDSVDIQPAN